jgi:hypothetical protein
VPVDFNELGNSGIAGDWALSCFAFLSDDFLLSVRPALVTITTLAFVFSLRPRSVVLKIN